MRRGRSLQEWIVRNRFDKMYSSWYSIGVVYFNFNTMSPLEGSRRAEEVKPLRRKKRLYDLYGSGKSLSRRESVEGVGSKRKSVESMRSETNRRLRRKLEEEIGPESKAA